MKSTPKPYHEKHPKPLYSHRRVLWFFLVYRSKNSWFTGFLTNACNQTQINLFRFRQTAVCFFNFLRGQFWCLKVNSFLFLKCLLLMNGAFLADRTFSLLWISLFLTVRDVTFKFNSFKISVDVMKGSVLPTILYFCLRLMLAFSFSHYFFEIFLVLRHLWSYFENN